MTLFQHTLGQLLRGEKTETSRLSLPLADGEHIVGREMIQYPMGNKSVMRGTAQGWRIKWQVGKTYAIQPARGVASIGQYRLVDIWQQDVRTLTADQIAAEGFKDGSLRSGKVKFFMLWTQMHDKNIAGRFERKPLFIYLDNRPTEFYLAWRMKIEIVYESINWDAPAVKALNINPYQLPSMTEKERYDLYFGKWIPPVIY